MSNSKVIAVVGATGAQGGGLVRAILDDPDGGFAVRALTRDPSSKTAKMLADLGVEVVKSDVNDEASVRAAFRGAYGAYCVTNFWEHFSAENETEQASNLARAAQSAGVKHVIWSTLEDTRQWIPLDDDRMPTLQAKYKVPHFDGKGEADCAFTALGVPTTFLLTSFYWENFTQSGLAPQRGEDGVLAVTFPMGTKPLPGIAVEDIGRCAYGVLLAGDEFVGKTVGIAGEHLTGDEIAAALTNALGEAVHYNDVPADVYRSFGFKGADDIGNMFQFKRDFNETFCGARNLGAARRLNPKLQTFDEWLEANAGSIPVD
jgi:uncharacterized protein YbjT (DUF2867 family)